MNANATRWSALSEAERQSLLDAAAGRLRSGGLAIAPTETVYGLMGSAAHAAAVARLREETGGGVAGEPRFTWHAPDVESVVERVELPTAVHRRLIDRLLPGPVRFVLEQPREAISALRAALKIEPGVIDDGERVAVRVSSHPAAQELIGSSGVPVIAERLGRTRWGTDDTVGELSGFEGAVIDLGPLPVSPASTTVRLALSGAIEVSSGGGVREADVLEALRRRIIFVCTGNTCRSPMAAEIGRLLVAERGKALEDGVELVIESAGISTGEGLPPAAEAVETIGALGGDLRSHRTRRLTREMVLGADLVLAMTRGHRERVLQLAPEAADRVWLVDPRGDIPDPIGGPAEIYRATADRLREVVRARFEELGI